MIPDRDYNTLADNAYEVDKKKNSEPIRKGQEININVIFSNGVEEMT